MDEFLVAAKAFEARSRNPVSYYDLGAALLLQYYSIALLTPGYVALELDAVLPDWPTEMDHLYKLAPVTDEPHTPEVEEALVLIGRAVTQRSRVLSVMRHLYTVTAIGAGFLHGIFWFAIVRAFLVSNAWHGALLLGGWILSVGFATAVCRSNLHWRPRARLRRGAG